MAKSSTKHLTPYAPSAQGAPYKDVILRDATPADASGIAAVETMVYGPYEKRLGKPHEEVVQMISKAQNIDRPAWVTEVNGEIVAYAKVTDKDIREKKDQELLPGWVLSGITVATPWQRKGIGRRLVQKRLDWLKQHTERVYYTTGPENHSSAALHESFGFVELEKLRMAEGPPGKFTLQRWFCLEF